MANCQQRAITAHVLKQFLVNVLGQFCQCCFSTSLLTGNELLVETSSSLNDMCEKVLLEIMALNALLSYLPCSPCLCTPTD